MKYVKENWIFLLVVLILCTIGGYFMALYSFSYVDPLVLEEGIKQVGSKEKLIIITMASVAVYAIIFGSVGVILSNKAKLWKKFKKDNSAIKWLIIISILGGLSISVLDKYFFGRFIEPVAKSYETKPTIEYIIGSFTYGGVFEEILLRLFLMSLISLVIYKLFYRKEEVVPTKVYVIANIISAIIFAAGHLPSTYQLLGYLDGIILFRCFLLNGTFGLAFGWLYRKYSIHYSMLAHFGCHLVSKALLLLFYSI